MSSNDGVESVGVVESDEVDEEAIPTPQGAIFQLLKDEQIATLIWNSLEYPEQFRLRHVCKGFGSSIKQHGFKYAAIKINDTRLITYNHYTWSGRQAAGQSSSGAHEIAYDDVYPIEHKAPEVTVALLDVLDVVQDVSEISMTFLERSDDPEEWNEIMIELLETFMQRPVTSSLRTLRLYWILRERRESTTNSHPNNSFQELYHAMAQHWPHIRSLIIRSTFESIAQFGPLLVGPRLRHIDIQAYCLIDPETDDEEADNWFAEMSPYIAHLSVKVLQPVSKLHVRGCWHELIHSKLDRLVKLSIPDFEASPWDLSTLVKRHKTLKSVDICIEIPPVNRVSHP